jgi:NAD(P)-dependent dehydrogenase (short-subunit alcohol dehydrogenase family)
MSQMSSLDRMFKEVRAELGMTDFLVNNAGIPIAQDSDLFDSE